MRSGVEDGAIAADAGGQRGEDLAVGGVEDDHVVLVAAGGEEDAVLGVDGETGAAAALAGDVVLAGHLERGGVDDGDGVLVFDVDVKMALAVEYGLLGGAAEVDGAEDGTVMRVEHRNVGRGVREDVDAVRDGVGEIAVGIATGVDGLDDLQGLRVEHGDRLAGGEAVVQRAIDGRTVRGAGWRLRR